METNCNQESFQRSTLKTGGSSTPLPAEGQMSAMKKKAPKGNSFANLYWLVKENEFDLIDTMCACTNVQSYLFNNIEKGYNNYFCYPSNDHSVLKIREYICIVIIIETLLY